MATVARAGNGVGFHNSADQDARPGRKEDGAQPARNPSPGARSSQPFDRIADMVDFDFDATTLEFSMQELVVFKEDSTFRSFWDIVLAGLLIYTSTVFPYQLCFEGFHIDPGNENVTVDDDSGTVDGWFVFEHFVDALWWADLCLNFVFAYRDGKGHEVTSLRLIVCHYLRTYFCFNLVACLPQQAVTPIINLIAGVEDGGGGREQNLNQIARLARLQRMTRLMRLFRLAGLVRLKEILNKMEWWQLLQQQRGMRIVNFVTGLFWIVHLMSCGWYLCAALHQAQDDTWVARRAIAPYDETGAGTPLVDKQPIEQWVHSFYFILTVFTTVGFGDISAFTVGEIIYVCFTMLVGAVVNGMIVSEMINVVTSIDSNAEDKALRKGLVESFALHTEMKDEAVKTELRDWADGPTTSEDTFDRERMRQLLVSGAQTQVSHDLIDHMQAAVFDGKLRTNKFLTACLAHTPILPPRLCLLIAVALHKVDIKAGEVVYQRHQHPFNIFLVYSGVFCHIGKATHEGGKDQAPREEGRQGKVATLDWSNNETPYVGRHDPAGGLNAGHHTPEGDVLAATASSSATPLTFPNELSPPQQDLSTLNSSSPGKKKHRWKQQMTRAFGQPKKEKKRGAAPELYPYKLICPGNFFGDIEVLSNKAAATRRTTVRCEVEGTLLVLSKKDVMQLVEEFPHFEQPWKMIAMQREWRRLKALQALTKPLDYREVATMSIQKCWRRYRGNATLRARSRPLYCTSSLDGTGGPKTIKHNMAYVVAEVSAATSTSAAPNTRQIGSKSRAAPRAASPGAAAKAGTLQELRLQVRCLEQLLLQTKARCSELEAEIHAPGSPALAATLDQARTQSEAEILAAAKLPAPSPAAQEAAAEQLPGGSLRAHVVDSPLPPAIPAELDGSSGNVAPELIPGAVDGEHLLGVPDVSK